MTKHCTGKLTSRLAATFMVTQYESIGKNIGVTERINQSNANIIGNSIGGHPKGLPIAQITCE